VKLIARALRDSGIHVIYSGLWQTPRSLAISARDEDVDMLACSMMSNSHLVLVPRLMKELENVGRPKLIVDVGGIIPQEDIQPVLDAGVRGVYHTGTSMLDIVEAARSAVRQYETLDDSSSNTATLARNISLVEEGESVDAQRKRPKDVVGFTGSPGAGKSTLTASMAAEIVRGGGKLAIIAYDPMSPISSGALLGDRLRVDFNTVDENVFYRSLARVGEDYTSLPDILDLIGGAGFEHVFVETVGAGQNDVAIRDVVDKTVVVLVPGMGDSVQMDKAGILEIADTFVVNKADYDGDSALVRELLDIASGRKILETIATQGKGVVELLDHLI
jgi:LAO/AO transport system ATPase